MIFLSSSKPFLPLSPLIIVLVIFVLLGGVDDPLMLKKSKAEKIVQIKYTLSGIIEWIRSFIFSWVGLIVMSFIFVCIVYFLMSFLKILTSFYP